jgi:hypothetical protein
LVVGIKRRCGRRLPAALQPLPTIRYRVHKAYPNPAYDDIQSGVSGVQRPDTFINSVAVFLLAGTFSFCIATKRKRYQNYNNIVYE